MRAFQKNQVAGAPRSSTVDDLRKHRTGDQAAARGPMLKQILGVGGWTLVSRVTGLIRDIVIAAVLGSGVMYEAFAYAFRLPNHFRAIFGEGAFNAAYVPSYAKAEADGGAVATRELSDSVFTLLLGTQAIILVLASIFMPTLVRLIAPGLSERPDEFDLVVRLTRITFPYLLLDHARHPAHGDARTPCIASASGRRRRSCSTSRSCFASASPSCSRAPRMRRPSASPCRASCSSSP